MLSLARRTFLPRASGVASSKLLLFSASLPPYSSSSGVRRWTNGNQSQNEPGCACGSKAAMRAFSTSPQSLSSPSPSTATFDSGATAVSELASPVAWPPPNDTIYQLSSGLAGAQAGSVSSSSSSSSSRSYSRAVGVAVVRISGPLALPLLMTLSRRTIPPQERLATRIHLYEVQDQTDLHPFNLIRFQLSPSTPSNTSPSLTPSSAASSRATTSTSSSTAASKSAPLIDSGILCLYFHAPRSFTGEEVVEFHVHGTPLILSSLFRNIEKINTMLLQEHLGLSTSSSPDTAGTSDPADLSKRSSLLSTPPLIRLATAGEFTRRAFENGKLDLTQVEALADLLSAETDRQKSQAIEQMRGELGRLYSRWRMDLVHGLAYIEAVLDFSEDEQDVGEAEIMANVVPKIVDLQCSIQQHLDDHRRGELVREGIAIVIVGAPNSGKSTLLNALAQREVAIVSPVPGTTRDVVENRINVAGWACIIADTAGLRRIQREKRASNEAQVDAEALLSGHDLIEMEGMKRTLSRTQQADIKLILLDASVLLSPGAADSSSKQPQIDEEVLNLIDGSSIVVWTKVDILLEKLSKLQLLQNSASSIKEPVSSASDKGKAKLRDARSFYAAQSDSLADNHVDALKTLCAENVLYQRVQQCRPAHNVFLACPGKSVGGSSQASALSNPQTLIQTSKGLQNLLQALEKQIQSTVGLDALTHTDTNALQQAKASDADSGNAPANLPLITRQRHRQHLEICLEFLELFHSYMARNDLVLAAEQLRLATREIGKITGRVDVEELLDVIFEDFCIGK